MGLVAGVDVGGTKVLAAFVDESGTVQAEAGVATDPEAGTASTIAGLERLLEAHPSDLAAVGVGAAAWVEHPSGVVLFAPNLTFERPNLADAVAEAFGVPVTVENDASAAAWGEHRFGAARGAADVVLVTVGTGVGGGIVAGGRLVHGTHGLAGEVGHMALVDGGPQCSCGQRGCLEALASGTAIARMAREGLSAEPESILLELAAGDERRVTGALVTEAARAGDEFAASVLERAGRWLGLGLANLTKVLDPGIIVIGGGGAAAGVYLIEPARDEMVRRVDGHRAPPQIVTAALGNHAGAVGAADLARQLISR